MNLDDLRCDANDLQIIESTDRPMRFLASRDPIGWR